MVKKDLPAGFEPAAPGNEADLRTGPPSRLICKLSAKSGGNHTEFRWLEPEVTDECKLWPQGMTIPISDSSSPGKG